MKYTTVRPSRAYATEGGRPAGVSARSAVCEPRLITSSSLRLLVTVGDMGRLRAEGDVGYRRFVGTYGSCVRDYRLIIKILADARTVRPYIFISVATY